MVCLSFRRFWFGQLVPALRETMLAAPGTVQGCAGYYFARDFSLHKYRVNDEVC